MQAILRTLTHIPGDLHFGSMDTMEPAKNFNFMQTITFTVMVGFLTVILGILVKLIGFPDQMRRNYQKKSTEGLSTAFIMLSFCAYVMWTLHGILINDIVVIVGQGLGIITTGAILWQIYIYRKPS